jgi:RNA polymerase sigma-70 factor (ECF subfamily)
LSCPVGHTFVRDHTVFWLYYRDGLTASEISRLPGLDLSLKGVESLLLRMARMVKQRLMV